MSGVRFSAQTAEIATGTNAKTLVQIIAAAHHRIRVDEISISFAGITAGAAPVKVRVLRQTTAGTVTSLSPVKLNSADDETLQVTAGHTATAEPTAGDVLMNEKVHPQTGFIWQAVPGREIVVPGAGRLGIEVTAGADVNAVARIVGDE